MQRFATFLLFALCLLPGAANAIEIQQVESPGGVTAWLVEDHSVPIVTISFSFRGGAALDPAGKEGLAEMASSLLDEGAGDMPSQDFQGALEDIAASLRFDADRDRFRGTLRTLAEERDKAFNLLRLALTAPRFDAKPVERIRAQILVKLSEDEENPRRIASETLMRTLFPDHPYGRPVFGTKETVKAITQADLRRFARERLTRDRVLVAVVGDITADEVARRLDAVFGALPAKGVDGAVAEATVAGRGRLIVNRKPIPQSVALFAQPGLKRDDPDWYAAYVMNYILGGGGFSSRLYAEVREKRGLAYSVYSYLNPLDHAGLVVGGVATRNRRAGETLDVIREEWRRIAEHGVTEAELKDAKTYINGSFPLRLDSGRRIAGLLLAIQTNRLGIDYVGRRPGLVNAVTRDDVARVARRLLDASGLTVVVVGDPAGIKPTE